MQTFTIVLLKLTNIDLFFFFKSIRAMTHRAMMRKLFSCYLLSLCIILGKGQPSGKVLGSSTLKAVNIILRHGARAPIVNLNAEEKEQYGGVEWPDDFGGLTQVGKNQMRIVGETLREMYKDYLSPYYKPDEIYLSCTFTDRTYMSAATLAAGLYPPIGHQKWSNDINWSPVPIWTDFNIIDKSVIVNNNQLCPQFSHDQTYSITKTREEGAIFKDTYNTLTKLLKKSIVDIFSEGIFSLWDYLECLKNNMLGIPSWTTEVYPKELAAVQAKTLRGLIVGTTRMIRLTAGPYMKELQEQFNQAKHGLGKKLIIHASHDFSVTAVLGALGVFERLVNPSDALIFELHYTSIGYEIQILYLEESGKKLLKMPLEGCGEPCLLTTFVQLTKKVTAVDWNKECQLNYLP